MITMALASSTAGVAQAVWAARNALAVLDELLASAKFQDDSFRSDVKQFLCDVDALQSRLAVSEHAPVYNGDDQDVLHAKLQDAMALCAGTLDQLTLHAHESGKAKSGLFRSSRKLSAKDEIIIRAKQRIPVHVTTAQLLCLVLDV
jgi:hypothetical protein